MSGDGSKWTPRDFFEKENVPSSRRGESTEYRARGERSGTSLVEAPAVSESINTLSECQNFIGNKLKNGFNGISPNEIQQDIDLVNHFAQTNLDPHIAQRIAEFKSSFTDQYNRYMRLRDYLSSDKSRNIIEEAAAIFFAAVEDVLPADQTNTATYQPSELHDPRSSGSNDVDSRFLEALEDLNRHLQRLREFDREAHKPHIQQSQEQILYTAKIAASRVPEGQVIKGAIIGPSDTEPLVDLARMGYHLTLIDASAEALQKVRHTIPKNIRGNFSYAVGDITGVMHKFCIEVIKASDNDVSFETFMQNVDTIATKKLNEVPDDNNGFMSSQFVFYDLKGKKQVTVENNNAFICSQFILYNLNGGGLLKEFVDERFGEGSFETLKALNSYKRLSNAAHEKYFTCVDKSLADYGTFYTAEKCGTIGRGEDIQQVRDPWMDYLIAKTFQTIQMARWPYDAAPGTCVPVLAHSLERLPRGRLAYPLESQGFTDSSQFSLSKLSAMGLSLTQYSSSSAPLLSTPTLQSTTWDLSTLSSVLPGTQGSWKQSLSEVDDTSNTQYRLPERSLPPPETFDVPTSLAGPLRDSSEHSEEQHVDPSDSSDTEGVAPSKKTTKKKKKSRGLRW